MSRPSRRDIEILSLAAEGMNYSQIAEELHLSQNSMSALATRMLRRMGAKNMVHAVAIYLEQRHREFIKELIDSGVAKVT